MKQQDLRVFELTARECAEREEDLIYDYMKRREFRLASMNSRDRDRMFDAMVEEEGIKGGWFYLDDDDGCPEGPYATRQEAIAAAGESK